MPDEPRLTETLPHHYKPDRCQSCAVHVTDAPDAAPVNRRTVWQECDGNDVPEPGRFVVLCRGCADSLIGPHPRLYAELTRYAPAPGTVLPLCLDCVHRRGVRCASPLALANGGPGITLSVPRPDRFHVRRQKPAPSGFVTVYRNPATKCTGKETRDGVAG